METSVTQIPRAGTHRIQCFQGWPLPEHPQPCVQVDQKSVQTRVALGWCHKTQTLHLQVDPPQEGDQVGAAVAPGNRQSHKQLLKALAGRPQARPEVRQPASRQPGPAAWN